jgi:ornithine carbamoyltransferase
MKVYPKHLVSWQDWSDSSIMELLEVASYIKQHRTFFTGHMDGRSIALLFQKTSTRTRVSFEAAMTEMGGHAMYIDWRSSNFELTDISIEAKYLSRNVSLIVARMKNNEDLLAIANGSEVPVINGCCNLYHPCQSLADLLTIKIDRGSLEGAILCYVGVHNNVFNSLIELCTACNVKLVAVTPLANSGAYINEVVEKGLKRGTLTFEKNLKYAVDNCEYVYTDTWLDMEFFNDISYQDEKVARTKIMMPYQLNSELLVDSKCKVMHDMPIHLNYEISEELVNSSRSIIFNQAENRLDTQKAIILRLLGVV